MWLFCPITPRYSFKSVAAMPDSVRDSHVRLSPGYANVFVLFKLYKTTQVLRWKLGLVFLQS